MNEWIYSNDGLVKNGDELLNRQDRGFRFGDGVFETIPIYEGKPYQWGFHYNRLMNGLKSLYISTPCIQWREAVDKLIEANQLNDGFVRIAISRGVGSQGYRPLPNLTPTLIIETMARTAPPPSAKLYLSDWRKVPAQCYPSQHKVAQGLNSTMALLQAQEHNCTEALMLNIQDELCEAASGNLFWIQNDKLYTPSLETGCLEGSTRHALCRLNDIQESTATIEALKEAEAVFITNCNWGILPVTELAPIDLRWPANHPLIQSLKQAYLNDIAASI